MASSAPAVSMSASVLFDLDGTIQDPAAGIIGSIRHALAAVGVSAPASTELHWTIGPPLRSSFPQLGVPANRLDDALAAYRERYRAGAMFEASVYDGIPAVLDALGAQGYRLLIATSKPHVFARPILERFGLARHFAAIHGAELDGRNDDKADLIGAMIEAHGLARAQTVMIGDRRYDVLGARANGLPAIGVLWGYGSQSELTQAGASALAAAAKDIPALVDRLLGSR